MGRGDNRKTPKMRRRNAQKKYKARIARKVEAHKAESTTKKSTSTKKSEAKTSSTTKSRSKRVVSS